MLTLRSGPAEVLASTTVTTFAGAPLLAGIAFDGEDHVVAFHFGPGDAPRVDATRTEGGWRFELSGFDDTYGRGSADPVLLAESARALLWMHFRVLRYGNSQDRSLHLTFYRTEKERVAWTPEAPEDPP